ncbi:MAG: DUF3048 domain-containing protein [Candidatus Berkelbacteria bacterium]|nr:DUF3048 domain-containing protein [Candidatus Berkelbacteria bacterium]
MEDEEKEEIVTGPKAKLKFKEKLAKFWGVKRNRWIVIISIIIIILAALALGTYFLVYKNGKLTSLPAKTEEKPQLYQSLLDGTMTDSTGANRHPLGIMVENHTDARPQSGLSQASIVYEAIAEGGITRFLAVYGPKSAAKVGPVRSARTYYVDWISELNGYLAHVGGNYDALQMIAGRKILDLDQFANPAPYWRDYSRNVSSEHTMYTDTDKLYRAATDKKYTVSNTFIPYKFKDDADAASRPVSQAISINFGNPTYNVDWNYAPTNNIYLRSQAGKPHIDALNNQQLSAKNVVVMTVKRAATVTAINEQGYMMTTVGTGAASIFDDGKETKGSWKKDNENARTRFFDTTGSEVQFDAGQTWIEVISPELGFTIK